MHSILSPKIDLVFKMLFVREVDVLSDLVNCVMGLPEGGKI